MRVEVSKRYSGLFSQLCSKEALDYCLFHNSVKNLI